MNNDLISREALKENGTVIGMVNGQKMKVIPLSVIDNAPTVEERSYEQGVIDGRDTEFDNGFEQGYAKGYENCEHDNERPQGEWIVDEEWITPTDSPNDDYKVTTYTCPFCGKVEYEPFGYCRCGAKLEKGGAV